MSNAPQGTAQQGNPSPASGSGNGNGNAPLEIGSGYLEINEKGFGFLRSSDHHFSAKPSDVFVTPDTIKKNFLREGALVEGALNPPHRGSNPQLKTVEKVNGMVFSTVLSCGLLPRCGGFRAPSTSAPTR